MIETKKNGPVTQIKMGRDVDGQVLYRVAAYLVDGLLIDTGCRHTAEELYTFLQDQEINQVYITHYHKDHIGGAALLQQKLGVKIRAHPRTVPLAKIKPELYPYQELVWGYPDPVSIQALRENKIETENYKFEVVETPGHSEDHTVLFEPEQGWCFSGDLFVSEKIKVLRPEEKMEEIMHSMRKLLDRKQELTLYTSIGKIEKQGCKALKSCLAYLEKLEREAKQLAQEEDLSTEQIVERLFGGESTLAELTNGQFAARHLVASLLEK